jgi:hypothetical protein
MESVRGWSRQGAASFMSDLTPGQARFADRAVARKRLFLILSLVGVAVAVVYGAYVVYQRVMDPGYPISIRLIVVLLVLLNARQNLRQYRYACALDPLMRLRLGHDNEREALDVGDDLQ